MRHVKLQHCGNIKIQRRFKIQPSKYGSVRLLLKFEG